MSCPATSKKQPLPGAKGEGPRAQGATQGGKEGEARAARVRELRQILNPRRKQ